MKELPAIQTPGKTKYNECSSRALLVDGSKWRSPGRRVRKGCLNRGLIGLWDYTDWDTTDGIQRNQIIRFISDSDLIKNPIKKPP